MAKRRTMRTGAGAAVAVVALSAAMAVPPGAALAAEVPRYAVADDAEPVRGTESSAEGPALEPGLYTDRIGPGETRFYSVTLDDSSTVYLSATAAPKPGAEVASYGEELTLRLETTDGQECDTGGSAGFHNNGSAYPVSSYAGRRVGGGIDVCQEAGPYLFSVSRTSPETSDQADWPVEIGYFAEPGLTGSVPGPPPAPDDEEEAPTPPSGPAEQARGGTSFNDAGAIGTGVWKDRLHAGESRFYRVPVDWGQRLSARLELPNTALAEDASTGYLSDGFGLQVYNPVRGQLHDEGFASYRGKQTATELLTAPVDYGRRFADEGRGSSMAGWWYVQVTLHQDLAAFFPDGAPVTLRTVVAGEAKEPPAYDGDAVAAGFGVTDEDREAAAEGLTAAEVADRAAKRRIGVMGVGTGTVLVAGLAVWWLLARRRAVPAPAGPGTLTAPMEPGGYGYPQQGAGLPGPTPPGQERGDGFGPSPSAFGPAPGGWPPEGNRPQR
ncbi:hypothetical protein JJV70_06655 [Streptomyces sp. JJ66]|uniref:hypothetical protein n=1 Tax=Streptomyces sp. JJ66 TaxID=2803843 RepID=UPI001C5716B7|nr:hypothetical protein [Streptomyces sp. JJ66]MBW1601795.1 hypothetical protein [Streptomyces sp. JJ66]